MDIERINYLAEEYKSENSEKRKNEIILEIWEAYHPKIIASTREMGEPQDDVKNEFFLHLKKTLEWWQPNKGQKPTTALQNGFFKFYRTLKTNSKKNWITLEKLYQTPGAHQNIKDFAVARENEQEYYPKHTGKRLPITNCISLLPPADRDVMRLRYEKGLSLKQISKKHQVTSEAVHYRIKKAEKRLKEIYVKKKSFFN